MFLDNKGFTLIEVLAVIVIIALLGTIAVPNVLNAINIGKSVSEKTMVSNIRSGAENLYIEVEFSGNAVDGDIVSDLMDGNQNIRIHNNSITVSLQGLVSNGFLSGTGENGNKKIINPKTGNDIGECLIKITKNVNGDDVSYVVAPSGSNSNCPSSYEG